MMLMFFNRCNKSVNETTPLPPGYGMKKPWNDFFYLSTAFPLFDYLFFGSAMEKSFYIFDKDLLFARNMVF